MTISAICIAAIAIAYTVPPMMTWESEQLLEFDPVPASATAARHFTVSILQRSGFPSWPADLLVSEVVTNVVRHAQTRFTVAVEVGDVARVTVFDGNSIAPAVRDLVEDGEDGRGLFLVQALALRWGVETDSSGKQVWFEVAPDEPEVRDSPTSGSWEGP